MLRSIGKQSGESILKKKRKATMVKIWPCVRLCLPQAGTATKRLDESICSEAIVHLPYGVL